MLDGGNAMVLEALAIHLEQVGSLYPTHGAIDAASLQDLRILRRGLVELHLAVLVVVPRIHVSVFFWQCFTRNHVLVHTALVVVHGGRARAQELLRWRTAVAVAECVSLVLS